MIRKKVNKLSLLGCGMFLAMMSSDLFTTLNLPLVSVADELLGVISWLGVALYLCHFKMITKTSGIQLLALFAMLIIGYFGNLMSGLVDSPKSIVTDAFIFSKPYIILIFWMLYSSINTDFIVAFISKVAKIMIGVLFFFSVVNQFVNLGMSSENGSFVFFSGYGGIVSWWIILFLSVIWGTKNNEKCFIPFMIMSGIIILLNRSGLGIISYCLAIFIYLVLERKQKIKWYYLVIAALLCGYWGRNEIAEYLLNKNAPRALFILYAFVTANKYFPLGSGFSTYGSAAAVQNYSKLYVQYGFNRRYGMTQDYHPYLMDNYYQQILGQLGYFGIAILMFYIYNLYKKILGLKDMATRNSMFLLFSCWVIASIGFGTSSSWGCTVYMLLPLFLKKEIYPLYGEQ